MTEVSNLRSRVDKLDGYYKAHLRQIENISNEIQSYKTELDVLNKAGIVLRHILDIMVRDEINRMSGLVTYGLKTIFEDQNLSFNPVITKKGDKICIELKTSNNGIEGEFGSFGGSVAVIESFILRILCVLKMNLARFIILDETFSAIGTEYIPNTSRLISQLSKKLGLKVLLVTHQKEFQQYADITYRVKESNNGLCMEKIS